MVLSGPIAAAIQVWLALDGGVPAAEAGAPSGAAAASPPAQGGRPRAPSLLDPLPVPSITRGDDVGGYSLEPAKDGSGDLVYQAAEFQARVARDGTVTFRDRGVSDFRWWPFRPQRTPYAVPTLESTVRGLLGRKESVPREQDVGGPPLETTTVVPELTRYHPDPRERCTSCELDQRRVVPVAAGRFDLTDELVRMSGKDPHRTKKARFLVATRETRIRMAAKRHAQNVRSAAGALPEQLSAIACDDRLSARDRRAILVALREEMDIGTAVGRAAAEHIEAFLLRFDGIGRSLACRPGAAAPPPSSPLPSPSR